MADRAIRARVTGRVQGVGYRQSCRQVARTMNLVGWVRNLDDGSVELFAQGESESLDKLVDWLWSGPGPARVTGVESDTVALDITLRDFFIHPNPSKTR
ncbi:MAG: acylphosphatase [Acidimicrobiia bacterium]